jgi:hypothetical protein
VWGVLSGKRVPHLAAVVPLTRNYGAPSEPDVVMGPGTKSGRCVYFRYVDAHGQLPDARKATTICRGLSFSALHFLYLQRHDFLAVARVRIFDGLLADLSKSLLLMEPQ